MTYKPSKLGQLDSIYIVFDLWSSFNSRSVRALQISAYSGYDLCRPG